MWSQTSGCDHRGVCHHDRMVRRYRFRPAATAGAPRTITTWFTSRLTRTEAPPRDQSLDLRRSGVEPGRAKALGLSAVRWGGNRSSRYNWKTQADNAGNDWFFLNGKAAGWSEIPGRQPSHGLASYLTVPMLPWIAKGPEGWGFSVAKYGPQKKVESYVADRGDGTRSDGTPITGNDPHNTSVPSTPEFQAAGIRALVHDPKRPIMYALDNEPMLWHSTHRDVFPKGLSYDECLDRSVALARAIHAADPSGEVGGPCTWGWTDLMYSAADAGRDHYASHADRKAHGDKPFLPWYLAGMKSASARAGKRLLDYVDVHFYPQGQADGQMVYGASSRLAGDAIAPSAVDPLPVGPDLP